MFVLEPISRISLNLEKILSQINKERRNESERARKKAKERHSKKNMQTNENMEEGKGRQENGEEKEKGRKKKRKGKRDRAFCTSVLSVPKNNFLTNLIHLANKMVLVEESLNFI